jgi:four helix bundle protein
LRREVANVRDHRKLRAFQLADELALAIYEITRSFPKEEVYGLSSQLRRAAVSIASNVVEGCARTGEGEYLRFLEIAHSSAREVDYQLSLAQRLGYLKDEPRTGSVLELSSECCKVLAGLIRAIRSSQ